MAQVLKEDLPPYADFAVFGPHGSRLAKKLSYTAFSHLPDGSWVRQELPGLPSFEVWWRCYRSYRALLLLLETVKVDRLDNYGEHIRDLHEMHGARSWWII